MEESKSNAQKTQLENNEIAGRIFDQKWVLTFDYTENQYQIQIEDIDSGQYFKKIILAKQIPQLTQHLVRKPSTNLFHRVFIQVISKQNENCNMTLSNSGEIKVFVNKQGGNYKFEDEDDVFQFQIQTQEEPLEPICRIQNVVKRLSSTVSNILSESDHQSVYQKNFKQVHPNFDPNTYNKAQFIFSDQNQSLEHKPNSTWYAAFTDHKLNSTGKYYVDIRIQKISTNQHLMMGIIKKTPNINAQYNYNQSNGAITYYLHDGSFYSNGSIVGYHQPFIFVGDIITLLIDMDEFSLRVLVNGYPSSGCARLNPNGLNKDDFFICFNFYDANDRLTLL